jgi:hypothetical protein
VRAQSAGEVFDFGYALVAALADDLGRAEFLGKLLPGLVTAHHDDALRTELLRG